MEKFPAHPRGLIIGYLSERLDVPVRGRVPNPRPDSFVRVLLNGGRGDLGRTLEEVAFTVESWDVDEDRAEDRANLIRAHLKAAHSYDGVTFYRYREYGAPTFYPDESEIPRVVFSFTMRFQLSA